MNVAETVPDAAAAQLRPAARTGESAVPADLPRQTVLGDLKQVALDLMQSRDLLRQLVLRDIRIRYKQAVLGFAWALLMPLVVVLAGLAVRVAFAYMSNRTLNGMQIAAIAVKAVPWSFFVGCINMATPSLVSNMSLVTKIYFPREVLPIGAVIAQTFDSSIGAMLIIIVLPILGVTPSMQLLWVPLLLLNLWVYAMALGLFLSCANLFFRDVKYLVQVFLTFGIFVTPVLLDAAMFGPKFGPLIMLNPIAPILEGLRLTVVEHHSLRMPIVGVKGFVLWHPWYLLYSATWALGGLFASALLFHRSERRFAEII